MRGDGQMDRLIPASLLKEAITRSPVVSKDEGRRAESGSEQWRRAAERRAAAGDREAESRRRVGSRMAHAECFSLLRHQDNARNERGEVQLCAIQIDMLRGVCGTFALGKQLCGGSAFGGTRAEVIELKLGMESPAEDGERQQQHRHTNRKMAGAQSRIGLRGLDHS